jgi:hypothetical protein
MFAELFVRSRLVTSEATATARNITAHESLFRIGFAGEILHLAADVAVAMILYALFRPVDRNIALLAAFMRLASDIVLAVASIGHFVALRLLGNAEYLKAFETDQLQSVAFLALRLHGDAYAICLVFFGFACLSLGYPIIRSSYLPRTLGMLLAIAGACYLVNSFAYFLYPAFAAKLLPGILIPPFAAELSLSVWLIVKGIDASKWKETHQSEERDAFA